MASIEEYNFLEMDPFGSHFFYPRDGRDLQEILVTHILDIRMHTQSVLGQQICTCTP
jgi:hypothetical protein